MKILSQSVMYENPLPQLRSRQCFFPNIAQMKDGSLAAVFAIGEAFESVDTRSYIVYSTDLGASWSAPERLHDHKDMEGKYTDYSKITALPDGRLAVMGYAYLRENPELPIGNPENGGVLSDIVYYAISDENGKNFSKMTTIPNKFIDHTEASAPITVLKSGAWITPITGFPDWNGNLSEPLSGRALISRDEGKSWSDDAKCMDFGGEVTCYEQRMCQIESGAIVCIGWNERVSTGERLCNHYTLSLDDGKTWSAPRSTGVMGQASSVCAIGGNRVLALHAVRRDTDRPGIYAYIVDLSRGEWDIVEQKLIWEPDTPVTKDTKMADIFSFLKFGQPGAILLDNGDVMMSHWHCKNGQYLTVATRIRLGED